MLRPVWPSLFFWYILGLFSSCLWLFSSEHMQFIQTTTNPIAAVILLTIASSWFIINIILAVLFHNMLGNNRTGPLFHGYERIGKITGYVILLFGNIGLYFFSERSVPCLLTLLSLSFHLLCIVFFLQPYTDFGTLDFLLSASLNQSLCLFRLGGWTWIVFAICASIASLRYCLVVKSSADLAGDDGEVPAVEEKKKKKKFEHRIRLASDYYRGVNGGGGGGGGGGGEEEELGKSVRVRYMKDTKRHFKKLLGQKPNLERQRSI